MHAWGGASGAELHRCVSTRRIDGCGRVERICVDTFQHCMHGEWSGTQTSHVSPRRGALQRYVGAWMHLRTPAAMGRDGTGRARTALTLASARRPAFSASQAAIAPARRRRVLPRPAVSVVAVPSRLGYPNIALVRGRGESFPLNSCDSCLAHPSVTAQRHRWPSPVPARPADYKSTHTPLPACSHPHHLLPVAHTLHNKSATLRTRAIPRRPRRSNHQAP